MRSEDILDLLQKVAHGELSIDDAVNSLSKLPFADLGHSKIDTHRELRSGFSEVIFAQGKTQQHLHEIVSLKLENFGKVLITKLTPPQSDALEKSFNKLTLDRRARVAYCGQEFGNENLGTVAVVSAGTSDAAIAAEASICSKYYGLEVEQYSDVGVAGLPRLISCIDSLNKHDLIIAVAGMEAALSSVLSGLCRAPIIVVPTSVGYGASFSGITALFGALVSCSPGASVVNIDNGFGAAYCAARTLRHFARNRKSE